MKVMLDDVAYMPERAHEADAGYDIKSPTGGYIPAHSSWTVDTGVHVQIPKGYVGFLKSKSGLNVNHGLVSEGVIDSGYTGSIVVKLYNHSDFPYGFKSGDKITQLVILPIGIPEPFIPGNGPEYRKPTRSELIENLRKRVQKYREATERA